MPRRLVWPTARLGNPAGGTLAKVALAGLGVILLGCGGGGSGGSGGSGNAAQGTAVDRACIDTWNAGYQPDLSRTLIRSFRIAGVSIGRIVDHHNVCLVTYVVDVQGIKMGYQLQSVVGSTAPWTTMADDIPASELPDSVLNFNAHFDAKAHLAGGA